MPTFFPLFFLEQLVRFDVIEQKEEMGNAQVHSFSLLGVNVLDGKTFIVTGSNTGIGFSISEALASKGANVIMAARNQDKLDEAIRRVKLKHPSASIQGELLDLSSLASVNAFVENVKRYHPDIVLSFLFLSSSHDDYYYQKQSTYRCTNKQCWIDGTAALQNRRRI